MILSIADDCDFCGRCSAVCMRAVSSLDILLIQIRKSNAGSDRQAALRRAGIAKCVQCGHCGVVCPKGIDVPGYILEARNSLKEIEE